MKTKIILVATLAVAAVCLLASLRRDRHAADVEQPKPAAVSAPPAATTPPPSAPATTSVVEQAPPQPAAVPESTPPAPVTAPRPSTKPLPAAAQSAAIPAPAGGNAAPDDPMARVALSFVGADPDAEQYWTEAINDPSLSADERQNLIEDLNEDGLSDPKHPGPGDLPLILNRLQLIEELAPSAMDQVNYDAFKEAYKDLVNLANLTVGQGEPVR